MTWDNMTSSDKAAVIVYLTEGNNSRDLAEQLAELMSKHEPKDFKDMVEEATEAYPGGVI